MSRSASLDIFIKCDTTRRCLRSHFRFILFFSYLNFSVVVLLLRFFSFFLFQAIECVRRQTSATDVEKEATGVLVARDFTKDLDPQANGSKEQSTHHSGINPVNQSSHDKAGVFEDTIKVDDMFSPTHELESGTSDPGSTPLSVQGRLKAHVQLWERINAPPFITECIREGYKIPFYLTPQTAAFKNNSSTLKHSDFVPIINSRVAFFRESL